MQPTLTHAELLAKLESLGWELKSNRLEQGKYVARGKGPLGQNIPRVGTSRELALSALLQHAERANRVRAVAKLGKWNSSFQHQLDAIAKAYADAPDYEQKAAQAWKALAQESKKQAEHIDRQVNIEVTDDPNPYHSVEEMRNDIHHNKHYFASRHNLDHPLWNDEDHMAYKIVHDIVGHGQSGANYDWEGENLAAQHHMPHLTPLAQDALFTETIGRAAYEEKYHDHGPQKIALLSKFLMPAQEQEGQHVHIPNGQQAQDELDAIEAMKANAQVPPPSGKSNAPVMQGYEMNMQRRSNDEDEDEQVEWPEYYNYVWMNDDGSIRIRQGGGVNPEQMQLDVAAPQPLNRPNQIVYTVMEDASDEVEIYIEQDELYDVEPYDNHYEDEIREFFDDQGIVRWATDSPYWIDDEPETEPEYDYEYKEGPSYVNDLDDLADFVEKVEEDPDLFEEEQSEEPDDETYIDVDPEWDQNYRLPCSRDTATVYHYTHKYAAEWESVNDDDLAYDIIYHIKENDLNFEQTVKNLKVFARFAENYGGYQDRNFPDTLMNALFTLVEEDNPSVAMPQPQAEGPGQWLDPATEWTPQEPQAPIQAYNPVSSVVNQLVEEAFNLSLPGQVSTGGQMGLFESKESMWEVEIDWQKVASEDWTIHLAINDQQANEYRNKALRLLQKQMPVLDETGNPRLNPKGKPLMRWVGPDEDGSDEDLRYRFAKGVLEQADKESYRLWDWFVKQVKNASDETIEYAIREIRYYPADLGYRAGYLGRDLTGLGTVLKGFRDFNIRDLQSEIESGSLNRALQKLEGWKTELKEVEDERNEPLKLAEIKEQDRVNEENGEKTDMGWYNRKVMYTFGPEWNKRAGYTVDQVLPDYPINSEQDWLTNPHTPREIDHSKPHWNESVEASRHYPSYTPHFPFRDYVREGSDMTHCIGGYGAKSIEGEKQAAMDALSDQSGWDGQSTGRDITFNYSIRDRLGRPKVTMETDYPVDSGKAKVGMIMGPGDSRPTTYAPMVAEFLHHYGVWEKAGYQNSTSRWDQVPFSEAYPELVTQLPRYITNMSDLETWAKTIEEHPEALQDKEEPYPDVEVDQWGLRTGVVGRVIRKATIPTLENTFASQVINQVEQEGQLVYPEWELFAKSWVIYAKLVGSDPSTLFEQQVMSHAPQGQEAEQTFQQPPSNQVTLYPPGLLNDPTLGPQQTLNPLRQRLWEIARIIQEVAGQEPSIQPQLSLISSWRSLSDSDPEFRFVFYKGRLLMEEYRHSLRFPVMAEQLLDEYGRSLDDQGYVEDQSQWAVGDVSLDGEGIYIHFRQIANPEIEQEATAAVHHWLDGHGYEQDSVEHVSKYRSEPVRGVHCGYCMQPDNGTSTIELYI